MTKRGSSYTQEHLEFLQEKLSRQPDGSLLSYEDITYEFRCKFGRSISASTIGKLIKDGVLEREKRKGSIKYTPYQLELIQNLIDAGVSYRKIAEIYSNIFVDSKLTCNHIAGLVSRKTLRAPIGVGRKANTYLSGRRGRRSEALHPSVIKIITDTLSSRLDEQLRAGMMSVLDSLEIIKKEPETVEIKTAPPIAYVPDAVIPTDGTEQDEKTEIVDSITNPRQKEEGESEDSPSEVGRSLFLDELLDKVPLGEPAYITNVTGCRWHIGYNHGHMQFCNGKIHDKSYCEHHLKLAYTKVPPKDPDAIGFKFGWFNARNRGRNKGDILH